MNKLQWNLNQSTLILFHENAFESVCRCWTCSGFNVYIQQCPRDEFLLLALLVWWYGPQQRQKDSKHCIAEDKKESMWLSSICGDHFVYAPYQWETTTLQCNAVSHHWLSACAVIILCIRPDNETTLQNWLSAFKMWHFHNVFTLSHTVILVGHVTSLCHAVSILHICYVHFENIFPYTSAATRGDWFIISSQINKTEHTTCIFILIKISLKFFCYGQRCFR